MAHEVPTVCFRGRLVVLNSVCQYFPHEAYLASFVRRARAGGAVGVFLGDVRAAELLAFQRRDVSQARPEHCPQLRPEQELCPPLALFRALGFACVRVLLHADGTRSHFERYRCDIYLDNEAAVPPPRVHEWTATTAAAAHATRPCIVRGVPNAAVSDASSAVWLSELAETARARGLKLEARPSARQCEMDILVWQDAARIPYCAEFHEGESFDIQCAVAALLPPQIRDALSFTDGDSVERFDVHVVDVASAPLASPQLRQPSELHQIVIDTVEQLGRVGVTADAPLMDSGINSLTALELSARLSTATSAELPDTLVFQHPTVRSIVAHLLQRPAPPVPKAVSRSPIAPSRAIMLRAWAGATSGVGVECCRAEKADAAFWTMQQAAGDTVHDVSGWLGWRQDAEATKLLSEGQLHSIGFLALLHGAERFGNSFFDIPLAEAQLMDPRQRLLLELGYEALHTASLRRPPSGSDILAIVGLSDTDGSLVLQPEGVFSAVGRSASVAAGRMSYVLNLHGPSLTVDTACSSSLVAIHTASLAIRQSQLQALACGASLKLASRASVLLATAGFLSPAGRCKTFDARADGIVRGEGVSAALFAGHVHQSFVACVSGALRQDGRRASLTAPNGSAQRDLILEAWGEVGARPPAVEAHGTGTALGDPTEAAALASISRQPLAVGAVKASLGHTEAVSGHLGIWSALSRLHQTVNPGNAQLRSINKTLHASADSVRCEFPLQGCRPPPFGTMGVSAFGFSGTIGHTVLQKAGEGAVPNNSIPASPIRVRRLPFPFRRVAHPLVQRHLHSTDAHLFRSPLTGALHSLIRDHRVRGKVIVPGAAFLEAARAAFEAAHGGATMATLCEVFFAKPLELESDAFAELHMDCAIDGDAFEIRSGRPQHSSQPGTVNCSGMVQSALVVGFAALDPLAHANCCSRAVPVQAMYASLDAMGLQYGPEFRAALQVWWSGRSAAARLRFRSLRQGVKLHPADLDEAMCLSVLASEELGFVTRVPFAVEKAHLREAAGTLWAVCCATPNTTAHIPSLCEWACAPTYAHPCAMTGLTEYPTG